MISQPEFGYRSLEPGRIVMTVQRLRDRITERFPDANLGGVAKELLELAREAAVRSRAIRRPSLSLRLLSFGLLAVGVLAIAASVVLLHPRYDMQWTWPDFLQSLESLLGAVFFLGAGALFVVTIDQRWKRGRCLTAIHELRAMAHIIDMHQLTKDPEPLGGGGPRTPSSPVRSLSHFELVRYLDYCSEMLSLIGKVAAIYVPLPSIGHAS